MKKINFLIILLIVSVSFFSCIKDDPVTYNDRVAEIDQATWNANAAGLTYPILSRVPAMNRPVSTADSTLRRFSGTIRIRVNLVGTPTKDAQTIGYQTFNSPLTSVFAFPATITGQTPAAGAANVTVTNAIAGTHYAALSGKVSIPADSSFGYIDIQILNAGAAAGQARFLGIRLDSSGSVRPSPNYDRIGLVIDQR